jgi:lipoprotein-anchoring transpeptidase ErfK/SrfK
VRLSRQWIAAATAGLAALSAGSSASAQEIGLWGGWNDYGLGWQGNGPRAQSDGSGSSYYDSGEAFPRIMEGGGKPFIEPVAPRVVYFPNKEAAGTILIDTEGRRLYYTLSREEAYDYPISVGREGFTWTGTEKISRVVEWPDWIPPKEMLERDPRLPELMYGGVKNPLGAIALYLGDSLYRIHGTNDPKTIGLAASSGCFRMMNEHVLHLASMAKVGTTVKVLPSLAAPDAVSELPWLRKPTALGGFGARGG